MGQGWQQSLFTEELHDDAIAESESNARYLDKQGNSPSITTNKATSPSMTNKAINDDKQGDLSINDDASILTARNP